MFRIFIDVCDRLQYNYRIVEGGKHEITYAKNSLNMPYAILDHCHLLHCSISHKDFVRIEVVSTNRVGIDLETKQIDDSRLYLFHKQEQIMKLKNESLSLTKLWTLKESAAKSIGLGFTYGINSVYITYLSDTDISFFDNVNYIRYRAKYVSFKVFEFTISIVYNVVKESALKGREVILGLLSTRGGLSGYQINDIVRTQLNHFYDGGYGMIYPTLKKLEKEGMVTKEKVTQDEKPNKNIFYITEDGKSEFQKVVNEKTEPEVFKSDLLLKLYFGDSLDESQKQKFLEEELERKKESLTTLQNNLDKWLENGMSEYQKFTADYGIAYYKAAISVIESKLNK